MPPDHRRRRVGQVVAVQVRRGDHAVLVGPQLDLLEHAVGDAVLEDHLALGVGPLAHLVLADDLAAELVAGQLVAPVLEGALRELHDVALVHQRHAGQLLVEGEADAPCG